MRHESWTRQSFRIFTCFSTLTRSLDTSYYSVCNNQQVLILPPCGRHLALTPNLRLSPVTFIGPSGLIAKSMTKLLLGLLLLSCWVESNSCGPVDGRPPDSSVRGLSQASILEQATISFSRASSWPRDRTHGSLHLLHCRQILYWVSQWERLLLVVICVSPGVLHW